MFGGNLNTQIRLHLCSQALSQDEQCESSAKHLTLTEEKDRINISDLHDELTVKNKNVVMATLATVNMEVISSFT